MSDTHKETSKTYDPFEPFRAVRDSCLDAMARAMVETVNTEAYAQATGTMLETYLSALAPFREALDKSMLQALQQMELPSRQEVAALAERFTNIEMRLDDMDAKLDSIGRHVQPFETTTETSGGEGGGSTAPAATGKSRKSRAAASQPRPRRRNSRRQR